MTPSPRRARPKAGDGAPTMVIVRTSELGILDDWYATGMIGTGSNSVVAKDVFVPAHRCLPLSELVEGRRGAGNPYFAYPLVPVLVVNAGGTPLGTARGALEAFLERIPGRPLTYTYLGMVELASLGGGRGGDGVRELPIPISARGCPRAGCRVGIAKGRLIPQQEPRRCRLRCRRERVKPRSPSQAAASSSSRSAW